MLLKYKLVPHKCTIILYLSRCTNLLALQLLLKLKMKKEKRKKIQQSSELPGFGIMLLF